MSPPIRFTQELILDAAYQLVRQEGEGALNARSLAKALNCSTQPLFRTFTCMEELRQAVVSLTAQRCKAQMLEKMSTAESPYLGIGLAYILYARDEPNLFKLLFMRNRVSDHSYGDPEPYKWIFQLLSQSLKVDQDTAMKLYDRTWVYTHGLAVSIATQYMPCPAEEQLISLLKECMDAALEQLKKRQCFKRLPPQ